VYRPDASVVRFGTADPRADRTAAEAANTMRPDQAVEVEVLRGKLPAGLELSEGGRKLAVTREGEGKYEVIGEVRSDYTAKVNSAGLNNWFWTWDYDDGWRKGLCYPQVPLKIATLGLWSYLSPLHYPCFATAPGEEADRVEAHLVRLQQATHAVGGNLVIVVGEKDATYVSGNQNGVSTTHVPAVGLVGFAVKRLK